MFGFRYSNMLGFRYSNMVGFRYSNMFGFRYKVLGVMLVSGTGFRVTCLGSELLVQ